MLNNGQQHSIEKSRQLQRNLYLAAKKDKQRRFHALYDRIFRLDILWRAWKEVRENKGSAGIDGITFEMIEEYGVEEYLLDIQEDLKNKKYRPKPVKRVYIPKPDGKQRPLGIPTIRDRIVQQACACFVSWCADQSGYIQSGVIPKFSLCSDGVKWFESKGRFRDGSYTPVTGDIIFFDWGNNGTIDHVGIVESVSGGTVNTIEGNSEDKVARRSYSIGSSNIYGYGVPAY